MRANDYRRFTATVGVNDSAGEDCHFVTFTVYGDRKVLATSRPLQWGQEGQQISVDISGVKIIALVARAAIDDPATLAVTWAEAALLSGSNATGSSQE